MERKSHPTLGEEGNNIPTHHPQYPYTDCTSSGSNNGLLRRRNKTQRRYIDTEHHLVEKREKEQEQASPTVGKTCMNSPLSEQYRDEDIEEEHEERDTHSETGRQKPYEMSRYSSGKWSDSVGYSALRSVMQRRPHDHYKYDDDERPSIDHTTVDTRNVIRRNTASLSDLDAEIGRREGTNTRSPLSKARGKKSCSSRLRRRRTHSFSHCINLSELQQGLPGWSSKPGSERGGGATVSFDSLASSVVRMHVGDDNATENDDLPVAQHIYAEFEKELAEEVENVLQRAAASEGSDRNSIMEDLFYNIASPIESQVAEYLRTAGGPIKIPRYYYQLLAQYFANVAVISPDYFVELQSAMHSLFSHPTFPAIYCLLFHLWLLGSYEDVKYDELAPSRLVLLTTGANRLFWADLQHFRHDFRPIFSFLDRVVSHPTRLAEIPERLYVELVVVIFRFKVFYDIDSKDSAEQLYVFFRQLPLRGIPKNVGEEIQLRKHRSDDAYVYPQGEVNQNADSASEVSADDVDISHRSRDTKENSSLGINDRKANTDHSTEYADFITTVSDRLCGTSHSREMGIKLNCFIHENAELLRVVQHENSLLRVLRGLRCFADPRLAAFMDSRAGAKLQDELYAFTSPGGPTFPTRTVRMTARETLDIVFPRGSGIRRCVSILFRLMHPYYWPGSFAHWLVSKGEYILAQTPCMNRCFGRRTPAALINLTDTSLDGVHIHGQSIIIRYWGKWPLVGSLFGYFHETNDMSSPEQHEANGVAQEEPKNSKVAEFMLAGLQMLPLGDRFANLFRESA